MGAVKRFVTWNTFVHVNSVGSGELKYSMSAAATFLLVISLGDHPPSPHFSSLL